MSILFKYMDPRVAIHIDISLGSGPELLGCSSTNLVVCCNSRVMNIGNVHRGVPGSNHRSTGSAIVPGSEHRTSGTPYQVRFVNLQIECPIQPGPVSKNPKYTPHFTVQLGVKNRCHLVTALPNCKDLWDLLQPAPEQHQHLQPSIFQSSFGA